MLRNRLNAARLVAQKLSTAENAIDDAIISAAELSSAFPLARREANVSPVVGQDAIALTAEAFAALQVARTKMVQAHMALADVRDEIGLREHATGDLWKLATVAAKLELVEAAA